MDLSDVRSEGRCVGVITEIKRLPQRAREVTIRVSDSFLFEAGQYFYIELLKLRYKDEKGSRRAFSISSSPIDLPFVKMIYRESKSGFNRTLSSLKIGDRLTIIGPFGSVFADILKSPFPIFVAGGVGLAPFLSLLSFWDKKKSFPDVALIALHSSAKHALYSKELLDLRRREPRFFFRESFVRFSFADYEKLFREHPEADFYISGPQGLIDHVAHELKTRGVLESRMHFEQYYPTDVDFLPIFKRLSLKSSFSSLSLSPSEHLSSLRVFKQALIERYVPAFLSLGVISTLLTSLVMLVVSVHLHEFVVSALVFVFYFVLYFAYRITRRFNIFSVGVVVLSFLVFHFLLITGGAHHTGSYWVSLYPVVVFLLLQNRRKSLLFSLSFLFSILLLPVLKSFGVAALSLSYFEFSQLFLIVALTTGLMYVFSHFIDRHEETLLRAHQDLERVNRELEAFIREDDIFRSAIQNSTSHVVITDINGVVYFANQAAQNITGYSLKEMIGSTPRLWGGLMDTSFYKELWRLKREGKPFIGEIVNRRRNGDRYVSIAHISPIFDSGSRVIGYIGTEEDITHIKETEHSLRESEARWQFALEGAGDGVWDWNVVTNEVFYSHRLKSMLGYSDREFSNDLNEWTKRVHPDDLARAHNEIQRCINGATESYQSEHRLLCKDGTYKWILDRGKVVEWSLEREPLRMVGTHTDITERKKAEEQKAYFEALVSDSDDAIVSETVDGTILTWNQGAERMYGYLASEMIGRSVKALVFSSNDDIDHLLGRVVQGEAIDHYETVRRRKDGSLITVSLTLSPVRNREGKIVSISVIGRDVSKEKAIDKAKTEFVSLASHQLRTPLSAINWYTEMLLDGDAGKLKTDQKKYLQEIYESNQRMVDLVNALLNVSRLELGTFIVEPALTDILALAQSVVDELKSQIAERKLDVKLDFDRTLPSISVDPKLLRIVFQNLLSNAVKYTPHGGVVTLAIYRTQEDARIPDALSIIVKDTGFGIPKLQQDKVFQKLFRADNARARDSDGTGLGLYIVKLILEQCRGFISFESEENKGTTFTVLLPFSGMEKKGGSRELS